MYAQHVLPAFGGRRVNALTTEDGDKWVYALRSSGLADATVRNVFVALHKAI
ncbi:hypothetical protein [Branchiibius hedensis]|uniref:hypothetical protein n=1 Tax=Branchiibius hedensis TaxID=672460 RepID=UPI0014749396|nr:hypothetical protein [Branchiibius hedensis]